MKDFRVGFGYDSHRFAPDRPLILGGIVVPFEQGLLAHSDGDVLIHAICDALLGAAGLKDIGTWFPDTDEKWKNSDSTIFLERITTILKEKGWKINNLDCTLILEAPKMKPFIDEIVENLSKVMQIDKSRIAVKAKTNEKMGFTGNGDGIAAIAAASIIME